MNSMSLSCLLFSLLLPLAVTEMLLVETHNDTKHALAPKTKPDETDQKGSREKRPLQVGQDYSSRFPTEISSGGGGSEWLAWDPALMTIDPDSRFARHHGCWLCRWRNSSYCKWVLMLLVKVVDCNDFKAE